MFRQRQQSSSVPTTKIMIARYKGKCLCGRSIAAGDQMEFDPIGRQTKCLACYQKQLKLKQQNVFELAAPEEEPQFAIVERLKQIRALPTPLSPRLNDEYDSLLSSLKNASECSHSTKLFLQSAANSKYTGTRLFAVKLSDTRSCTICKQPQTSGCFALMEFPSRQVRCLQCECK